MSSAASSNRARRPALAATFLVALVFVRIPGAHAQYTRTELPESRFHLGPIGLSPRLALVNAGHDSNVYQSGAPVSDSSVVVRGALRSTAAFRQRLRVVSRGWVDYSLFVRQDDETAFDPGADARVELDLSALTFVGGAGIFRARQLYSIDLDQRVLREERFVYGGAEWRPGSSLSFSAGAETRSFRYDPGLPAEEASAARILDRDGLTARAQLRYRLTSLTTLVGSADLLEDEFQTAPAGLGATRSYRYLGGFEFGERALISGRLLAGVRDIPQRSAGTLPPYRSAAAVVELTLPILHYGRLTTLAQRDVVASIWGANAGARNAYVLTGVRGTLEWALPLQLLARLTAGYDEARYLRPVPVDDVLRDRLDHQTSFGGSLLRRFGESIRVGVTGIHYRRTSSIPGAGYARWVYGLQAEVQP